ncbi:MAG: hypothetical protein ACREQQ_17800 [Candidatus Binatia bacterium]
MPSLFPWTAYGVIFLTPLTSNLPRGAPVPFLRLNEVLDLLQFHMLDSARASRARWARKPPNVVFTGFLPRAEYLADLASAGAVMVLTTRPDAMQFGAGEAAYLEQPLILSDHPQLRRSYPRGAIFVANTADGVAEGVREMQASESLKRAEIGAPAADKRRSWESHRAVLRALLRE